MSEAEAQFVVGKTYWLPNGTKVELVGRTDDGRFIVCTVFQSTTYGYDGDVYDVEESGDQRFADALCMTEPKEVKCGATVEAERCRKKALTDVAAATDELSKLRGEIREAKRIIDSFGDIEALSWIDRLTKGEATHVVTDDADWSEDRRVRVLKIGDARATRMASVVTLMYSASRGIGKGTWHWSRKDRYNGGERQVGVIFCFSEEEAIRIAGQKAAVTIRNMLSSDSFSQYSMSRVDKLLELHKKDGLPLPADVLAAVDVKRQSLKDAEAENLRQEIEEQRAKLAKMEAGGDDA